MPHEHHRSSCDKYPCFGIGRLGDRTVEGQEPGKIQNELRAEAFEHETRFASLHDRRADIIAELYRLMAVAQERIAAAAQPRIAAPKIVGMPESRDTLGSQAYAAYEEFETYVNRNRLYLTKDQAEMADEIVAFMRSAALAARFLRIEGIEDINEEFRAKRREELDKVMEQLPEAEEKLEDSLRELIGAELES